MLRDDLRITNGFENAVVKKVAFVFASAHPSQLAALRPTSQQQRVNSMLNHKRNTVTTRFSSGHRTAGFAKASGWTPAASDGVEAGGAGCRSGPLRKCKLPRPRWQPKGGGDPSTGASAPGGRRSAGSKREASAGPLMSAAVASPPSSAIESAGVVKVAEMGQGFKKTEEDPYGTVGIVHEGIMKQAVRDVRDERAAADHNETLLGARHSERSMAGR